MRARGPQGPDQLYKGVFDRAGGGGGGGIPEVDLSLQKLILCMLNIA